MEEDGQIRSVGLPDTIGRTGVVSVQTVERELAQLRRIQTIIRTKRKLLERGRRAVCGQVFFEDCPPALLILSEPIHSADPAVAAPILYEHLARCHREGWNEGYPFGAMISGKSLAAGRFDEYACYFTQVEHPAAGVPLFEKPAGRYAAICLQGDYHRAREAYRQLLDEISARGLRPVGCSYKEGLWDEIAQRDPAQYRTKISVAVE